MTIGKPFNSFKNVFYPKGSITQYFGVNKEYYGKVCPLEGKCLKGHNGIDFVAMWGTPILAVEDGYVEEANNNPSGYGKHVRVISGDNEWTYGHLSKLTVSKRQQVKRGDVIGHMGNTGLVFPVPTVTNPLAGTHLHLGLRRLKGGVVQEYENGFFGSVDFADMLPLFDPINDDIEGFMKILYDVFMKLQKAGIQLQRPK